MKPSPVFYTSYKRRNCNYNLLKFSKIVENAFSRQKAQFTIIRKRMKCNMVNLPVKVRTRCALHDVCEHFNNAISQLWSNEIKSCNAISPQVCWWVLVQEFLQHLLHSTTKYNMIKQSQKLEERTEKC